MQQCYFINLPFFLPQDQNHVLGAVYRRELPMTVRCRALYDCEADNEDELSFSEGEVLLLIKKEEDEWWEGMVEGQPHRRGMFPATFVEVLTTTTTTTTTIQQQQDPGD